MSNITASSKSPQLTDQTQLGSKLIITLKQNFIDFWQIGISFLLIMVLLRGIETWTIFNIHTLEQNPSKIALQGLIFDMEWSFYILGILFLTYLTLGQILPKFTFILIRILLTGLLILQAGLFFYFTKMLLPLGEDLYAYSISDIIATVKASGELNLKNLILIGIALPLAYFIAGFGKYVPITFTFSWILTIACYSYIIIYNLSGFDNRKYTSELENFLTVNKSYYFYNQSYNYFASREYIYFDFFLADFKQEGLIFNKSYIDPEFPFLHENNYPDVLSPFFDSLQNKPDIVFVIVEGLGKAYSGEDAYLGSFTPFLDSLSNHSLYWKNGMSTTGRTFGVLVGLFGSLPFAQKGFMDLAPEFPQHLTLLSLLKSNGYHTNYHIGADKAFDNVGAFLSYQEVDRILDISSFDPDFEETPSRNGFSWGYPDKAMFENGMRKLPKDLIQPQLSIFQTQTSHDPFIIPNEEKYFKMLDEYMVNTLKAEANQRQNYLNYRSMYASILYVDEAIKEFFEEYKKMPRFNETIFIITGDHRLPEVPMSTTIDRFHVPILIYSPLLKSPQRFHGLTTHFDVTPTLLSFLNNQIPLELPSLVSWKGYVMDTSRTFQSQKATPLMRNKNQLIDFIDGEYVISDEQLFQMSDNLNLDPIYDNVIKEKMKGQFKTYKASNAIATGANRLLPDSLMKYHPSWKIK